MMTLKALLQKGTEILSENEIQEAGLDAWLLLEYVTGKSRAYYFAHSDEMVSEKETEEYFHLIGARGKHIPLQHLTHVAYFMGFEFKVDENVLIPRQDTETLVETALELAKGKKKQKLLDMCTGSGCILLSFLALLPQTEGVGVDISVPALQIARENAAVLGVQDRARFVQSDLFAAPFFTENTGKDLPQYDILISNPPYIRSAEIDTLMEEVKFHDPRLALDGHKDGLYFYRKIICEGKKFLVAGGWMLFEIGYDQGADVSGLLLENGFTEVKVIRDLAGLDRVVIGKYEE